MTPKERSTDLYFWRAVYDGYHPNDPATYLDEYDVDGRDAGFAAVDLERLTHLWLLPQREGLTEIGLRIAPGFAPVFFRTRWVGTDAEGTPHSPLTTLGLRKGDEVTWLRIFADGSVLLEPGHTNY